MKKNLFFMVTVLAAAVLLWAFVSPQKNNDSKSRKPASLDEQLAPERYQFSPATVQKIARPVFENGERMIQSPVVPSAAIRIVLKHMTFSTKFLPTQSVAIDAKKSIAWNLEMKYGIHPLATSYYENKKHTFGAYSANGVTTKMGVAPNCLLCHSSRLGNDIVVGLGNTRVDLKTFFHDITTIGPITAIKSTGDLIRNLRPVISSRNQDPMEKLEGDADSASKENTPGFKDRMKKRKQRMDMMVDMLKFVRDPRLQSDAAGHSNPWSFAVELFNWRAPNMDYLDDAKGGRKLELNDVVLDPMPWWLLKYKKYINWDNIIQKSPRSVVQAAFSPGNSGEDIRKLEPLFNEILAEAEMSEPLAYPFPNQLNRDLIAKGEKLFNGSCNECHGTHSRGGDYYRSPQLFLDKNYGNYPEEIIEISHINTDRRRLDTINYEYLDQLEKSWMAFYVDDKGNPTNDETHLFRKRPLPKQGYLAPPLWGLWASAPYFHNGSVPNLRGVLFPEERPSLWRLTIPGTQFTEYDYENTGLMVETNLSLSKPVVKDLRDTKIYDVSKVGMSNKGHEEQFEKYSREQKMQILEYLKTL